MKTDNEQSLWRFNDISNLSLQAYGEGLSIAVCYALQI